jgi:N-methylhydantoinase B
MAGGYGARPHADGIDTGGLFCIPMGRIPDVEMTEFLYPLLTLWRREEPDSGGPGRHRGGVGASVAITPHGTSLPMGLVLASAGKAVAQNGGLSGGHPGNSGLDVIARQSRVAELLAAGTMPATLAEVSDTLEIGQNYASSYLAPGEVFAMTWQGGGGYGDPLTRDPGAVARDLREEKITAAAAQDVYGVVLVDGAVDAPATEAERDRRRGVRRDRSAPAAGSSGSKVDASAARRLDDNLIEVSEGGTAVIACAHCHEQLGEAEQLRLGRYEGPATDAGPQILTDPTDYIDEPVVFRQYCCPGCWTALYSAVVPAAHVDHVGAQTISA